MTERSKHTTSGDYGASSSTEIRGGYSDIYSQVGIRMYQLPPKIVEALRRNGPSIIEGASTVGSTETVTNTGTEPVSHIDNPDPEPAVITPIAAEANPDSEAAAVAAVISVPVPQNEAVVERNNGDERYHTLPYRVMQALAKSASNNISVSRKESADHHTAIRTTESSAEPVSVADAGNGAMVDVASAVSDTPERRRFISIRTAQSLGEHAIRRSSFKDKLKSLWQQEHKVPKMAMAVGVAAVAVAFAGDKAQAIEQYIDGNRVVTTASSDIYNPVVEKPISTLVIGGNTQVVGPVQEVDAKSYAPGNEDQAIVYSADMAIGNPFVSPDASIEEGSNTLVTKYYENRAEGKVTHISSYSFGTYAAQDAAWRIYTENGNKWPDDLSVDILEGPQGPEGIDQGNWGKFGTRLIGLRPSNGDNQPFPPGANVRLFYNERSPYASGGNENSLSLLYSIVGMAYGTHEMPDRNDPSITWTMFKDANGIEHWVAHYENEWVIDALQSAGIQIMDTESANEAIRALFPRNDDPNAPPPEADVKKALTLGARALDHQIDPSGNTKIFETIVERMPDEWKELMNTGWNGINHAADAIAKALADPTPQNINAAVSAVTGEIGNFMGGLQKVFGGPVVQNTENWVVGSTSQIVRDVSRVHFGEEIDIEPQLTKLADMLLANAKTIADNALAKAQENQTLGQNGGVAQFNPDAANSVPQNNPLITVSANTLPNTVSNTPNVTITLPESSRVGMLPDVPAKAPTDIPTPPPAVSGLAPMPTPSSASAEVVPSSSVPAVEAPKVQAPVVQEAPVVVAPAPVYEAPKPVTLPPPVYEAPAVVMPAPVVEAPAPVVEAPAPVIQAPAFQMPKIDLGEILKMPAPSASPSITFTPPPAVSIPNLNDGMILEPVG